jgi:PadR family transcriptional regulator, regulatory protein PadR
MPPLSSRLSTGEPILAVTDSLADRREDAMPKKGDLLTGTLDLLVLKALQLGDVHGWGIMERIRQTSGEVLQVHQGSLYPALYRLKRQGLIGSQWRVTENNRRARYYSLTARGRERLAAERQEWRRLSAAVERVLAKNSVGGGT